ncbi:MAG: carbohydrate porin [Woeseiaceae bacterium]
MIETCTHRLAPRVGLLLMLLGACSTVSADAGDLLWDGGVTAILQHSDDARTDSELTASADLFITLPRSKGEWLLYMEASTTPDSGGVSAIYPTANADAGSVLNRDGDGGVQVSEFHYTRHLRGDRRLMVGLINPSAWLDRSYIANDENRHFINGSFKNNTTIEFPDYTLGIIMRWLGAAARPEIVLVVAGSDGIADLPDRSYQDLLDLSSDQRGLFVGAGASWLGDRTSLRLGTWLRTDDHAVAGSSIDFEKNYGVYGVLGWRAGDNAVNLRLGAANEDVSVATRFVAAAYERSTRFGLIGLGLARTRISNNFRQADLDDVASAEAFVRIAVGDTGIEITPSVQHVQNPGFDASGATSSSSALVAGVRFHWSFTQ